MAALTTEQIDREIASRTKEVDAIAHTLVELDSHAGLQHVRRYPPVGTTAQRWTSVEAALSQLWEDLGRITTVVQSAQAIRAQRSRLGDDDRDELTRLLRERTIELSRQRVPLAQRTITSPAETVQVVGLAELTQRMRDAYPAVVEFLDAVDAINSRIAAGLSTTRKRLDESGAAGPPEIAELLQLSATDPLALTANEIDTRVAAIAASVEQRSAELAELAALRADWPAALVSTAEQLDALREGTRQANLVRARAEQLVVSGPLPMVSDIEPELRARLQAITTIDPVALRVLRQRIATARGQVHTGQQLAQGLLDRHNELKGRLTAYQAKAARLGLGEDHDLLASGQIAAGLLSRRPCDLRAVTRSIADYQQLISEKRGQRR